MKQMKFAIFVGVISVLCLVSFGTGLAELPYGAPKANTEVSDLVPFELLEKIAVKKAQGKWGQVAPGPPLPACDDDGDIVAYLFPFAIGTTSFPSYSEILSSVKYGRKVEEQGLKAMTEVDKQKVFDAAKKDPREKMFEAEGKSGPIDRDSVVREKAKRFARQKMIGGGEFGTVVVSARYDRFPIPLYMHYLPPYFYQGDLAEEKARSALSADSVTLEKIYFLERMRAMYFEYSTKDVKDNKILVQSHGLHVEPHEKVLTGKGMKRNPEPEVMRLVSEQWEKVRREVE